MKNKHPAKRIKRNARLKRRRHVKRLAASKYGKQFQQKRKLMKRVAVSKRKNDRRIDKQKKQDKGDK